MPTPTDFQVDLTNCDREPIHIPGSIQPHGVLFVVSASDLRVLQASANAATFLGAPSMDVVLDHNLSDWCEVEAVREALAAAPTETRTARTTDLTFCGQTYPAILHHQGEDILLEIEQQPAYATPDLSDSLRSLQDILARVNSVTTFADVCDLLAREIHGLTGFDRVMVYRFHEDAHGEVTAESHGEGIDSFLGLHYPASDIPKQARALYLRKWLRLIPDVQYEPAPIEPPLHPGTHAPVDLSHVNIRSVSPIHVQYLTNMGVGASMSISLVQNDTLWGLVACHHYAPHYISLATRTACELLAAVMSTHITTFERNEHLKHQSGAQLQQTKLLQRFGDETLTDALTQDSLLLELFGATGAVVQFGGERASLGDCPSEAQCHALIEWMLAAYPDHNVVSTHSLADLHPPAAAYTATASGVLGIVLSETQQDVVLLFRPEFESTVDWAGEPKKAVASDVAEDGTLRLLPRTSFEKWKQAVLQQSRPWTPREREQATDLRNSLITLIIERANELRQVNTELERRNADLDAFNYIVSHDLKEPLRGIYSYAYYLNEHATRGDEQVQKRIDGLMSLTARMNELLDSLLHVSRVGRYTLEMDEVDLNEVLSDAREIAQARQDERGGKLVVPRPLPRLPCDYIRVREVFVNLISNGFKYNRSSPPVVEVGYIEPTGSDAPVTFYVKDNGIGIKPRYHDVVFNIFKRLHGRTDYGGGTGAGLAIVQKIVERHGGSIWLESTPSLGTTFFFTLEPLLAP
ncbi:MAG: ATP-binding protein [Rhodothermales bacterium]